MNSSPVIGILCIDTAYHKLKNLYESRYKSYIPASYVKFLESAGAKVVPIWIGKDKSFYRELMKKLNGVLLPGGALYLHERCGYPEAGTYIYEIACEMNEQGDFIPILGICLGYELMLYTDANKMKSDSEEKIDPRQDCEGIDQVLPLHFKSDLGRMFTHFPREIIEIFQKEAVTFNYHRYCITEEDLVNYNLWNNWKVLSTNKDKNGLEYISSIEHKKYPFYGLQFHPEKNAYEELYNYDSCKTYNAIQASQYLAHFFVNEARKCTNHFESIESQYCHLIYNYPVVFTGLNNEIKFIQCYLFDKQEYGAVQ